jgi:hypothetical protein
LGLEIEDGSSLQIELIVADDLKDAAASPMSPSVPVPA